MDPQPAREYKFEEGSAAFRLMMDTYAFSNPKNPYQTGSDWANEWDTGFDDAYEFWRGGW